MKLTMIVLIPLLSIPLAHASTVVPRLHFAISLTEKARAKLIENQEKGTVALYYTADFKDGEDPQTIVDSQMSEFAIGAEPVIFVSRDLTKVLGRKGAFSGVFLNAYSNRATSSQNWLDCSAPSIEPKDLQVAAKQLLGIHCALIGE